jgi:hypothetical protein
MKQTRGLVNGLVVCGIALAMAYSVAAQNQGTAKVVRIKGNARYSLGNDVWEPLKVGTVLRAGSVIQTENRAGVYVDLVLYGTQSGSMSGAAGGGGGGAYQPTAAQYMVRLLENSQLGIDKLTSMQTGSEVVTDTQLDLKKGRVMGSVKKLSAASKYEVKLPNGVAGIRGTTYLVTTDGMIDVLDGSVVVAYQTPSGVVTQVVSAGQSFNTNTGQLGTIDPATMSMLQSYAKGAPAPAGVQVLTTQTIIAIDQTSYFISPTSETGAVPPISGPVVFGIQGYDIYGYQPR